MSIKVTTLVWAHAPYGGVDLLTLLALSDVADDAGVCRLTQESIAKKSRLSSRKAQGALGRLEKDGQLSVLPSKVGPATYRINLGKLKKQVANG